MLLRPAVILFFLLTSILSAQVPFDSRIVALEMTSGANPVYLAGLSGGLFRSEDNMATWRAVPLGDDFSVPQPDVLHIEADPSRPSGFYAAGNRDTPSGPDESTVWIARSDDNGVTWAPKIAGLPAGSELRTIYVIRSRPGTVYAYLRVDGEPRVYKSTDRAESWSLLRTLPTQTADQVLIHLNNPNLWYYETGRAIFISRDEGASWGGAGTFPVRRADGAGLQNTLTDYTTDPDNESILLMSTNGPVFGSLEFTNDVFFSDDQGSNWERKGIGAAQHLHIDRGITMMYRVESARMWVSPDAGRTVPQPNDVYEGARSPDAFLVDRRDNGVIYVGTLRSPDRGRTWTGPEPTVTPLIGSPDGPLEITASTNDIAPRIQRVSIEAFGRSNWELDFTIESSAPWLRVAPTSGTTRQAVSLEISAGGLPLGLQEAALTIRSAQSVNETATIPVRLTVTDEPAPAPSPAILTFAGNGGFGTDGDGGPAAEAELEGPAGLALGPDGSVFIADSFADNVRRVAPDGVIATLAGDGGGGFAGDGGPATQAQLNGPQGLAVDEDGVVFIADRFNRRVRVVDSSGEISTYFGTGEFGSIPDQGDLSDLQGSFSALAAAPDGALYASGSGTVRIAQDGSYLRWTFRSYRALAVGPDGKVYAVAGNQVYEIRPNRFERVIAGQSDAGFAGDGGPAAEALLSSPEGIAVDADGRIFVADSGNNLVRLIDTDGTIRAYAGTGVAGFAGDGGPANLAQLDDPTALAVGPEGELYIAESRRVRVVLPPGSQPPGPSLTSAGIVSAASFAGSSVAPEQIVSIFGANFGFQVAVATSTPLPDTLGGVRVELIDSAGATHRLALFFVAPGQINALIPAGAALGQARLRVVAPGELASEVPIAVEAVTPGLFAADASGSGLAAAAAIRVASDGAQTPIDLSGGAPIDLGPEGDQVVLLLFGTGFRNFAGSVEATIGGVAAQAPRIAPQPQFVGLDQLNVIVPRELSGRGEVEIRVTIDGKPANVVTIVIG